MSITIRAFHLVVHYLGGGGTKSVKAGNNCGTPFWGFTVSEIGLCKAMAPISGQTAFNSSQEVVVVVMNL